MFGLYDMVCNYSCEVACHLWIYWNSEHLLWFATVSAALTLFTDRYAGLGGIAAVTDVLPSLQWLHNGNE